MDLKSLFVGRELPRNRTELIKRLAEEANTTTTEMFKYILGALEDGVEIEEAVRDRMAPVVRVAGGLPDDLLARHKAISAYALNKENIETLETLMTLRPELMEDMSPRMRVMTSGPWTRVMLRLAEGTDDLFAPFSLCLLHESTPSDTQGLFARFLVDTVATRPELKAGLANTVRFADRSGKRSFADDLHSAILARRREELDFMPVDAPLLDEDGNEIGH